MGNSLYEELINYSNSDYYPFHMPGHKRNRKNGQLPAYYQYDITEIDGFDNLHQPEGIIKEAQQKAAALYHSEETYFLINGSTSGILSAVSAVSEKGGKLLIARNCHKAVYHAAFLNRMELCYVYPRLIQEYDLAGEVAPEDLKKEIDHILAQKDAKIAGVVIASPTYDGISSDVKKIAELVHTYGIPLIVDQAHGAHFGFHPDYPPNAVNDGADIVIHSVHKTLAAPTQTAILHKNGNLVNSERLQRYLHIYQSSSPSYPLMAGIETALKIVDEEGYERLERMSGWHKMMIEASAHFKHIRICPLTEPGKLIISVKGCGMTGGRLYDIFRERYHLQMEMASGSYVTAILSMMDTQTGISRLISAIKEIEKMLEKMPKTDLEIPKAFSYEQPKKKMELWEAYLAPCEQIDLNHMKSLEADQSFAESRERQGADGKKGMVAAEFINLYPPGIPLLVPGEIPDENLLRFIVQYVKKGYNVQGIENNKIKVVMLPEEGENYEKN